MTTTLGPVLDDAAWQALLGRAEAAADWGEDLRRLPDGRILKIFRARGRTGQAGAVARAARFRAHARELAARGFAAPVPEEAFEVPDRALAALIYRPIPGESLRAAATTRDLDGEALAAFFARLHAEGVYFRAAHPGNLILLPAGGFGLVDVTDVRFRARGALGPMLRARNLRHLLGGRRDAAIVRRLGVARFVAAYLRHAGLGPTSAALLRARLAWSLGWRPGARDRM